MMVLEKLLRSSLGNVKYYALRKLLAGVQIAFDANKECLVIYRDGCEPLEVYFCDIEDYVNNVS